MKILNSITTAGNNGNDNLVFQSFPDGKQCIGLRLRLTVPLTVASGGGTVATANLQAILAHFTPMRLNYGANQDHPIWPSVGLDDIRTAIRQATQRDIQTSIPIGTAVNAGALSPTFDLFWPFEVPRFRGHQKFPGTSQMRTFKLEVAEGGSSAMDSLFSRAAGNATWDVVPVYIDGPDQWSPVLSLFKMTSPRLEAIGPDGLTLAAWDANAVAASTAIVRFSNIVGSEVIDDAIYPALMTDENLRQLSPGGSNIDDTVTTVYLAPTHGDLEAMIPGPLMFRLVNQDVVSILLRGLYFPPINESEGAEAAVVASQRRNVPVLATGVVRSAGSHAAAGSVAPLALPTNGDAAFYARAGKVGFPNGQSTTSVPATLTNAAQASAAPHGGAGSAAGSKVARATARGIHAQIPGGISTRGARQGSATAMVTETLGAHS
jgi:hypothetical protein